MNLSPQPDRMDGRPTDYAQKGMAIVLLAMLLSACTTQPFMPCTNGQEMTQTLLHFGRGMPTDVVTEQDWQQFLEDTVTPRFPDGFSTWPASGQWRSQDGSIVQEDSYVLNVTRVGSVAHSQSFNDIVRIYKARFQQESVLRIDSQVCAQF